MLRIRPHIIYLFILVSISLFLQSCESLNGPNTIDYPSTVKSESKWLIFSDNSVTNQLVSHKEFDRDGNLTSFNIYYETGQLLSNSAYTYTRNKSKEEKVVFSIDGAEMSTEFNSYVFDDNGNITEKEICNGDGNSCRILTYAYDSKGNIIKKVESSTSDSSFKETEFQYNYADNGLVSERIVNPTDDGSYLTRDSIIYEQNKNLINRFTFNSDGMIDYIQTYEYDAFGKLTFEYVRDSEGEILKQYKFEYEYYN